ncbi:hypothetical protein [Peredibacter starrii]|uniref:Uncharacterized protein n=1 Tax=Peredibacter starrii TaxID=28202 RepID=A0AAX4HKE3_9BACT|nr:hypothetical protein [Peredibacter starrii]WPU63719.1 hypothetical protein SOO65_13575 [Peredibacter starrii]
MLSFLRKLNDDSVNLDGQVVLGFMSSQLERGPNEVGPVGGGTVPLIFS